MKKIIFTITSFIFISCGVDHADFSGKWVEKKQENEMVTISKNGKNYLVEIEDKKFPAQVKDELLEISTQIPVKATIDDNDHLIIAGDEYIRIEKSLTYKKAKFKDCSFGDIMHINFEGIDEDFGEAGANNNFGEYELCIEDNNGNTIPNPKYAGKEFILRWEIKKIKVIDIFEPWKTNYEDRPVITYLELVN